LNLQMKERNGLSQHSLSFGRLNQFKKEIIQSINLVISITLKSWSFSEVIYFPND
jgi:hypothetical protein